MSTDDAAQYGGPAAPKVVKVVEQPRPVKRLNKAITIAVAAGVVVVGFGVGAVVVADDCT